MARKKKPARNRTPLWPIAERPWRLTVREPATPEAAGRLREIQRNEPVARGRQQELLLDPDEAVACAALDRFGRAMLDHYTGGTVETERSRAIILNMLPTLEREAKAEGLLWTPRLDRLRHVMPPFHDIQPMLERYHAPLTAWTEAVSDVEELKALWRASGCVQIHGMIATHARVVDEELLTLDLATPDAAMRWSGNTALTPDLKGLLFDRVFAEFRRNPSDSFHASGNWPWTLAVLIKRQPPSSERQEQLVRALGGREQALISYVLRHLPLTKAQFDRIYALVHRRSHHLPEIAAHARLDGEQALDLWKANRTARVGLPLLANPAVQASPALRYAMSSQGSVKVARDLFRTESDPALIRTRWQGWYKKAAYEATEALDGLPDALIAAFEPEDLLPALEHREQRVRLAAIQAVSRMRGRRERAARERPAR